MTQRTHRIPFRHSPFPLIDSLANTFFDVNRGGRRGRNSPRGGLYWEDETYSDNHVLLSATTHCTFDENTLLIVFFHGNQATLDRDIIQRQRIPQQMEDAKINAILIAPQLAVDALDSSAGNFSEADFFNQFLDEAIAQIGIAYQKKISSLNKAKILLIAYSGGYNPAGLVIAKNSLNERVAGIVLMDALYDHETTFSNWINANAQHSFFFSCFTEPCRLNNESVENQLTIEKDAITHSIPSRLVGGSICFFDLNDESLHAELMTQAWTTNPLTDLLKRLDC